MFVVARRLPIDCASAGRNPEYNVTILGLEISPTNNHSVPPTSVAPPTSSRR